MFFSTQIFDVYWFVGLLHALGIVFSNARISLIIVLTGRFVLIRYGLLD